MESLKAIRDMNDKHPDGRLKTSVADLCDRVEELERAASEKAQEGPQEAPGLTEAPTSAAGQGQPTDADLIAYIETYPRRSLSQICERFGVAWGGPPNYTEGAREIRNQLQRLRSAGKIRTEGQRWTI